MRNEGRAPRVVDGGRLAFSPVALINPDAAPPGLLPIEHGRSRGRALGGSSDEDFTSYLVDQDGNEYEPYSLAWRYLGMYIDCDIDEESNQEERRLGGSDSGSGDGDCERVLLWAAVSGNGCHLHS